MAVAHVQSPANGNDAGSVTSSTLAFGSNNAAGNVSVVTGRVSATGRTITVSDTKVNTYVLQATQTEATDVQSCTVHYAKNIGAGANTVTFAISGAAATTRWTITELSGADTTTPVFNSTSATATSTNPAAGNLTPTIDGSLFYAVMTNGVDQTVTAGTDFALRSEVVAAPATRLAVETYAQPTAAIHNGNFTAASTPWTCISVVFQPTSSAAVPRRRRMLLGIG